MGLNKKTEEEEDGPYKVIPSHHLNPILGYTELNTINHESIEIIKPDPLPSPDTISRIKLGNFDYTLPPLWMSCTLGFNNITKSTNFMEINKLKRSLSLALGRLPILTGTLMNVDGTKLNLVEGKREMVVKLNNRGMWLCVESTELDFHQIMEDDKLIRFRTPQSLIFNRAAEAIMKQDNETPLLSIKLNYFPCGSVIITTYFCHLIGDGKSMMDFMNLWGDINRGKPTSKSLLDSRNILVKPDETLESKLMRDNNELNRVKLQPEIKPLVMCTITIPLDQLNSMKLKFNQTLVKGQFLSRDDLLCTLIWRALLRSRDLPPTTLTRLKRSVDLRHHLKLPHDAFGNFVMGSPTGPITVHHLLNLPLPQATLLLRQYLTHHQSQIHTYQTMLFNSNPDQLPHFLEDLQPTRDLYISSVTQFLANPLYLDPITPPSPALLLTPTHFLHHSLLLLLPPLHHTLRGIVGIEPKLLSKLQSDPELRHYNVKVYANQQ